MVKPPAKQTKLTLPKFSEIELFLTKPKCINNYFIKDDYVMAIQRLNPIGIDLISMTAIIRKKFINCEACLVSYKSEIPKAASIPSLTSIKTNTMKLTFKP